LRSLLEVLTLPGHFIRRRLKTGEGRLVGEDSVVQLARLVAASPHLMFHTFFFLLTSGCLSKRRSNFLLFFGLSNSSLRAHIKMLHSHIKAETTFNTVSVATARVQNENNDEFDKQSAWCVSTHFPVGREFPSHLSFEGVSISSTTTQQRLLKQQVNTQMVRNKRNRFVIVTERVPYSHSPNNRNRWQKIPEFLFGLSFIKKKEIIYQTRVSEIP